MPVRIREISRRWLNDCELTVVVDRSVTVERPLVMLDRLRDIVGILEKCRSMETVRNVVVFGADDREVLI